VLPLKNRLPLKTELSDLKKNGHKFSGQLITLVIKKRPYSPHSRFATIVSKKISSKAVDRNLLRRRLKAIHRPFILKTNSLDILALPKKAASTATFDQLQQDLSLLFKKLSSLK